MHFRGFPGIFEHRAPPYVPYISVDFARFLGTEVPPGYHTLAEMYERGGATLEALRGGVSCRCNYNKKAEAKYGLSFRNIAHIDIGYICIILFINFCFQSALPCWFVTETPCHDMSWSSVAGLPQDFQVRVCEEAQGWPDPSKCNSSSLEICHS